jgi:hypothetical protein
MIRVTSYLLSEATCKEVSANAANLEKTRPYLSRPRSEYCLAFCQEGRVLSGVTISSYGSRAIRTRLALRVMVAEIAFPTLQ